MIYPKFLKKNNCIGIPAPSDGASNLQYVNRYKNAKLNLENLGYKLQLSNNLFSSKMGRSSSTQDRAEELNKMFESNDLDAIICAAGGEFLVEILPYINFEKIAQNPKWVEGFSDPTGILFPITTKYDISTIYGNNFGTFGMLEYDKSIIDNLEILKGNIITEESYELYEDERIKRQTGLEGYNLTKEVKWKTIGDKKVKVRGRIIAGCLDIIMELSGTKYDGTKSFIDRYKSDGIIWCFDNCELSKEELIRSLWKLNELGYFTNTNAVIFGRNGTDNSYLDYTMEQTIKDSVLAKYNIPVIFDADISHKGPSMTIINGAIATVLVNNGKGQISFELK